MTTQTPRFDVLCTVEGDANLRDFYTLVEPFVVNPPITTNHPVQESAINGHEDTEPKAAVDKKLPTDGFGFGLRPNLKNRCQVVIAATITKLRGTAYHTDFNKALDQLGLSHSNIHREATRLGLHMKKDGNLRVWSVKKA